MHLWQRHCGILSSTVIDGKKLLIKNIRLSFSTLTLFHCCFMRVPLLPIYHGSITCLFTCVHKLYQKDLISKAFIRGRVVRVGTVDYELPLRTWQDCDLFCEMKADLWPCTSDERGTPLFPKWKWTGGTKWAKHTLKFWGSSNDGMKPAEKVFNVLQVYKNPLHFCIYYRNSRSFKHWILKCKI